jgi:2-methylcitrate dehydratase PrpD
MSLMKGPHIADRIAAFARPGAVDIPAAVIENAQLRLIDSIGIGVSASVEPFADSVVELAREWYTPGDCSAMGFGRGLSAPAAGFVNGILVHGQDFDDTHTAGLVHPSACIVPAALALGERHELDADDVLRLASVGYEIMVRIGLGASPGGRMHARGFHTTAVAGAIAVAAMAAATAGADEAVARNAVALATSVASGLTESARDGTFAKGVQPGLAVQGGMWAASAAARGMTGPVEAFEGRFGLYEAFAGLENSNLDRVTDGLGDVWTFPDGDFKLYPVCHHLQAHVDSALSIHAEAELGSGSRIASIEATVCEQVAERVCVPLEERLRPSSAYSAKFSLHYAIAMGLTGNGFTPAEFSSAIADERLQQLAASVRYETATCDDFPALLPGSLTVELEDGRVFERVFSSAPGKFGRPVRADEIDQKFLRVVGSVVSPDIAARSLARLHEPSGTPARELLSELVPPRRRSAIAVGGLA